MWWSSKVRRSASYLNMHLKHICLYRPHLGKCSGVTNVEDGFIQTDERLGAWNVGFYDSWPGLPLQVSWLLVCASRRLLELCMLASTRQVHKSGTLKYRGAHAGSAWTPTTSALDARSMLLMQSSCDTAERSYLAGNKLENQTLQDHFHLGCGLVSL